MDDGRDLTRRAITPRNSGWGAIASAWPSEGARRVARSATVTAFATLGLLFAGCAPGEEGEGPPEEAEEAASASVDAPPLPPGADDARARVDTSPRHGEWAMVPAGESDSVRAWVVYPERSEPAPVVLVVHEIFGLTTWIRAVADQLAAEGFVAVAPDLLSGREIPEGEDGDPERDAAVEAIRALDPDEVHRRLTHTAEWAMALPAATERYGIVGYCWGGSVSFAHATRVPELGASVVYYGSSPEAPALEEVQAPVLGLYGGDDARVNATVPRADSVLSALDRTFEAHFFDGAGHGFLRQQDGREGANAAATRQAWPRTVEWFRRYLEG